MILKNEEGKLNFIIDTLCSIGFEHKGASFAVHRLAFEIASRGHNVYVFNEPFYQHENITVIPTTQTQHDNGWYSSYVWEGFSFNYENTVTIYTQNTWSNPFGTKYNCRWILHDYNESQWKTYGQDDVIYNYGSFKIPEGVKQEKLTIFDYKLDTFKNQNKTRKGVCSIIHKFTPEWGYDFLKQFDSKDLTNLLMEGKFDELANEFNKYEILITFDIKSYITTAAALCGCKVVLLNTNKDITPLEYRINNPTQMCGIAYGWEDIKWAKKTLPLVRKNIENLEKMDVKTINLFVDKWVKKLL
jgi:hypothetical protein